MIERLHPPSQKNIFFSIKNLINDSKLKKETRPGATRIHRVTEKKQLRNQRIVATTDELAMQINKMADTGQYPLLTKWLKGEATSREVEDVQQIIGNLRTRIAKKYGIRVVDLEKERDDQVDDFRKI